MYDNPEKECFWLDIVLGCIVLSILNIVMIAITFLSYSFICITKPIIYLPLFLILIVLLFILFKITRTVGYWIRIVLYYGKHILSEDNNGHK